MELIFQTIMHFQSPGTLFELNDILFSCDKSLSPTVLLYIVTINLVHRQQLQFHHSAMLVYSDILGRENGYKSSILTSIYVSFYR